MEIWKANEFVLKLQEASTAKKHLAVSKSGFHVVDAKTDRTLNSQMIEFTAHECLNCYAESDLPAQARLDLMNNLMTTVHSYNSHAFESNDDPIGMWLDKLTELEDKITSIASLEGLISKVTDHQMLAMDHQLSQAASKMLESTRITGMQDAGFPQALGIKSYLNDLKAYKNTLKPPLPKNLDQSIQALEFALALSHSQSNGSEYEGAIFRLNLTKNDLIRESNQRLLEKITSLKEKGAIEDFIVIPGGYTQSPSGHAVLYQIKKTGHDTCSFTIINSGDGSRASNSFKGFMTSLFTNRMLIEDAVYENIHFDVLNTAFISELNQIPIFKENEPDPMRQVIRKLDSHLLNDKGSKKTAGREHKAQTTGSCAFKSVSSWIKGTLEENDYNKFKLFVSEREMARLQHLRNSPISSDQKAVIDSMISKGQKVLEARKEKIT